MPHEREQPTAIDRRRVLRGAAWTAPAILVASAVPASAATSGPTTTTISVTTAHDYRTGQTPGAAPTNALGTGGAARPHDNGLNGSQGLNFALRITNTGTIPLQQGFAVTFDARASQPIARGTLAASLMSLWTGLPTSAGENAEVVTYVHKGANIPIGGHVDLVGKLDEVAGSPGNNDLPLSVMVGGSNIASPATGLYGAPNTPRVVLDLFVLEIPLLLSSTYPGSNGSSFPVNTDLRAAYPAYY